MTSLGPLETDSNTLSKEALSHHVEKIALFIESKKPEIQNKLRQNGRSRVAHQVSALPTNSKEPQTASFNDVRYAARRSIWLLRVHVSHVYKKEICAKRANQPIYA